MEIRWKPRKSVDGPYFSQSRGPRNDWTGWTAGRTWRYSPEVIFASKKKKATEGEDFTLTSQRVDVFFTFLMGIGIYIYINICIEKAPHSTKPIQKSRDFLFYFWLPKNCWQKVEVIFLRKMAKKINNVLRAPISQKTLEFRYESCK